MLALTTIPAPVPPPIFDVVAVSSKPSFDCVSVASLQSIQKYLAPREILVIRPQLWPETNCGDGPWGDNLRCLSEDYIIPGVTKRGLEEFYRARGVVNHSRGRSTAGWMLQQFLKLGVSARRGLSTWYLVVDSDMIFIRKHPVFTERGRAILYPGGFGRIYAQNVRRLIDIDMTTSWLGNTYVSHSMIMNKRHVRAMLNAIAGQHKSNNTIPAWVDSILQATIESPDPTLAFSEYSSFSTYALNLYPRQYTTAWAWAPFFARSPLVPVSWTWLRGGCCPTSLDLWTAWLVPTLHYVGFERGHTRACRASLAAAS